MTPEQVQDTMVQANAAAKNGEYDKAQQLLGKLEKDNPSSKDPWLRSAQIHFDQGKYGPSIVAAQEALQRDPADKTAKSIVAVAGLRVSVKALGELRNENGLTGTTRTEAEQLTASLRESLGETTLVPAAAATADGKPAAPARGTRHAGKPASARRAAPSADTTSTATSTATPTDQDAATSAVRAKTSGNPFGALQ